jgi:uncharacterized protein YndB with AHSA1/START domain
LSPRTIRPAPVRKSVIVATGVERAFEVFTAGIARWWPATHSIGRSPQKEVILEPCAGGRWYERGEDGSECTWGKVLAWEPPARLLLAWQIDGRWTYDPAFLTEVEVTFTALGATETRVELEHRNLERYGDKLEAVRAAIDSEDGWAVLLRLYAEAAGATRSA